uniref:Patj homolog n=1 Tax=Schistocephalus solidus TaxID=70667 RepID=A0A0X3NX12_SCHSO
MLDQQSLDQIVGILMQRGETNLPAPNLNHLAIEILKVWLNAAASPSPEPPVPSTSAGEHQGFPNQEPPHRRRSPLQLTVARSDSHFNRLPPRRRCPHHACHAHKPQWDVLWSATIPADPSAATSITIPKKGPQYSHGSNMGHIQEPEEGLVEVELIDFVKSECGIGAFLRPSNKGIGAKVEKIAEGELAAIDGRLHVDDRILYINAVNVCIMRFKEILRVYRAVADRARTTDDIQRGINFRPIRLVVSRPANCVHSRPTEASLQKLVVPKKSVLQAARDLARLAESPQVSGSSFAVPTVVTLVAGVTSIETVTTDPLPSVATSESTASASADGTTVTVAASCRPSPSTTINSVPCHTPFSPPPECPASSSSPLLLVEETEVVERDFSDAERDESSLLESDFVDASSKSERRDSSLVGAAPENVGGTSWEMNSLPDTPTARELASALVDDIMGEFEACSGKGVDLLQTDIAEDPLIENLPLTPYQRIDLRRFWRSTFRESVLIIVADYRLPPSNHSFGLTVETVIEEDERASIREYRHYLLEVYKDGPIGTQTDLRPRDELLEVNGVILYGKDSEMVRRTLTSASSSGYIVCARPQVGGPFPAEVTPFSIIEEENEEDITVDASSPTNLFDTTDDTFDSTSTELSKAALAPRTAKPTEETVFSAVFAPGPAVPSQSDRTPSSLLVPIPAAASDVKTEVPAVSMPGTAVPTDKQSRVPSSPEHVAPPTKDELPDFYDDEQPLIITKREAELLGLQLGPPVDKSWGFPITEIAPGGPLYRLINTPRSGFLAPNVQVGDEVVEVNGRRLKGLRIFTVRSILWDLVPFEGEVSLKYRPTSLAERAVPGGVLGDPPKITNLPQIRSLDQNIFMRMQTDGNLGFQSSVGSNSRNHVKGTSSGQGGLSAELNLSARR